MLGVNLSRFLCVFVTMLTNLKVIFRFFFLKQIIIRSLCQIDSLKIKIGIHGSTAF